MLVFFSISGYLICSSWVREPLVLSYLVKRAFRILPALILANVVTAFVIGAIATNVPRSEYFTSPNTWIYPLAKSLLFVPGDFDPPGIFAGNPWHGVNPSLWTLPVEISCYAVLLVVMLLARALSPRLAVALCATGAFGSALLGSQWLLAGTPLAALPGSELVTQSCALAAAFFTGAVIYLVRDRIPLRIAFAAIAAVLLGIASITPLATTITPLLVPYIVMTIALRVPAVPLGRFRGWDLSYAIYLFGFPIQQLIVWITDTREPLVVMGIATVVAAAIAAVSWRLIEKPAISLGHRITARLRPVLPLGLEPRLKRF